MQLSGAERGAGVGRGATSRFFVWGDNWGGWSGDHWSMYHTWQPTTYFILCAQWSHISFLLYFLHHFSFSTFSWDLQFTAIAATTTTSGYHVFTCSSAPSPKRHASITKNVSVLCPPGHKAHSSLSCFFFLVEDVAILQVTHASSPWHHFSNVWSTRYF